MGGPGSPRPRTTLRRTCPDCGGRGAEDDAARCRLCGRELLDIILALECPRCGTASGSEDRCGRCGARLVIGPPIEDCFPAKPFDASVRPVTILQEDRSALGKVRAASSGVLDECDPLPSGARLAGLQATVEEGQMSGVAKNHLSLSTGESVRVFVRGVDPEGNWFALPPEVQVKWRSERELEVKPRQGDLVTVRLLAAPRVSAVATARTTVGKKRLSTVLTVEKK